MRCSSVGFSLRAVECATEARASKGRQAEACPTGARSFGLRHAGILALVVVLLVAIPARATTYYVAAAGSDSNSGTDTGHPWQTIAKVNAATFSAGDSILFNRGDVWYGTALTAPSSGAAALPSRLARTAAARIRSSKARRC